MKSIFLLLIISALSCSQDTAQSADFGVDMAADQSHQSDQKARVDTSKDGGAKDQGRDLKNDTNPTLDMGSDLALDMEDVTPQKCTFPTTDPECPQGNFGPGSFFTKVEIVSDDSCCFDFTGDQHFDNEIGTILGLLAGFGVNANQNIAQAIQFGDLAYILEYVNWSNEKQDADFQIHLYYGDDLSAPYDDNLAGTGSFTLKPESFNPVTKKPRWEFKKASVKNGQLNASEGNLRLAFPGLLDAVQMQVVDAHLTGRVDPSADLKAGGNVILHEGELSGALLRDEFFESMNEAAVLCPCMGNAIFSAKGDGNYDCSLTTDQEDACRVSPTEGCRFLGQKNNCRILGNLGKRADVDTDGDSKMDAFSFGAKVEAVGAKIVDKP